MESPKASQTTAVPVGNIAIENLLWQMIAEVASISIYERAPVVKEYASRVEAAKADRYLTEKQVAERWPNIFSCRWLQESRRLRKPLRYFVLNRKVLYLKSDVESFIETHALPRGGQVVSSRPTTK